MRGRQPLKITWLRNRNSVQHSILDSARRTSHVPLPAISSFGGLRTPAPECVAPSSWAGIRKPSQKPTRLAQQTAELFDHIIGLGKQRWRDRQTERFCGVEINFKLEASRLFNRDIGGPFTLQYS